MVSYLSAPEFSKKKKGWGTSWGKPDSLSNHIAGSVFEMDASEVDASAN